MPWLTPEQYAQHQARVQSQRSRMRADDNLPRVIGNDAAVVDTDQRSGPPAKSSPGSLPDKSFVQRIIEDESDATIVRAIITLAEGLNLQVLAEGVETLKQLQALLALECKEVQGFYFSEALTAIDVEVILINYNRNLSSRHDE